MKFVVVLLLVAVAYCEAKPFTLLGSPIMTYSAPKVKIEPKFKTVEIKKDVISKYNLNVFTDDDKISTTEIKPVHLMAGVHTLPYWY